LNKNLAFLTLPNFEFDQNITQFRNFNSLYIGELVLIVLFNHLQPSCRMRS